MRTALIMMTDQKRSGSHGLYKQYRRRHDARGARESNRREYRSDGWKRVSRGVCNTCHGGPDGWTTVGTELHIKHRAATPVGLAVRAVAEVTAVDGRAVALSVKAYDEREEIGSGTHTRFAVASDTFMAKAEGKR